MSASLVGSEMCIRDRPPVEPASVRRRLGTIREEDPAGAELASEEADPVSYTHLTLPTICSV
eukprot:8522556-Alexandrium_andersonii.AAC.1